MSLGFRRNVNTPSVHGTLHAHRRHARTAFDSDEANPTWFANALAWAGEFEEHVACEVRLERMSNDGVPPIDEFKLGQQSVLLTALTWRDPSA
jgi:hypothetical protein